MLPLRFDRIRTVLGAWSLASPDCLELSNKSGVDERAVGFCVGEVGDMASVIANSVFLTNWVLDM